VDDGTGMNDALVLSWSGGKDSALALHELRRRGREPAALLTTVTQEYDRISMHGVRRSLLRAQSRAVGVPLEDVLIPPECTNEIYEERMGAAVRRLLERGVSEFAFGDLFLEDVRAYREAQLAAVGARATFPLWGRDTGELAREFIGLGFKAVLVTVDPKQLHPSFCGCPFDEALLDQLPDTADPMGENGEFHTFVYEGPVFGEPLDVVFGPVVERDGFYFCDVRVGS